VSPGGGGGSVGVSPGGGGGISVEVGCGASVGKISGVLQSGSSLSTK
jgi:hypothetical protein